MSAFTGALDLHFVQVVPSWLGQEGNFNLKKADVANLKGRKYSVVVVLHR